MRDDIVNYRWVVGNYYGEQARKILNYGGMTYKIWNQGGKGDSMTVTAASKWVPSTKPLAPHVEFIRDKEIIQKLEEWSKPWLKRSL